MATISDEVFSKELDDILKQLKIKKNDRSISIAYALNYTPKEDRDAFLEGQRKRIPKKEHIPTEDTEQINFVEWFRKTYPDVLIMAIWNGGSRTPGERAKQIAMGLHPGAADLEIPAWGVWPEIKRTKEWKWSEEQQDFASYVKSIGQTYLLCIGCEDAKEKVLEFVKNNLTK